jgi:hypothetical protein
MLLAIVMIRDTMPISSGKTECAARLSFPKRYLSPLRRACLTLGLEVDARPSTNLSRLLRKAGLGKTGIEFLKFSNDDQARRILDLYHALSATERKAITIDYLAMAAGVDIHHVWGMIQEGLSRVAEAETVLVACINASDITHKAVEYALTPDGYADRELIMRILGVAPLRTAGASRMMRPHTHRPFAP